MKFQFFLPNATKQYLWVQFMGALVCFYRSWIHSMQPQTHNNHRTWWHHVYNPPFCLKQSCMSFNTISICFCCSLHTLNVKRNCFLDHSYIYMCYLMCRKLQQSCWFFSIKNPPLLDQEVYKLGSTIIGEGVGDAIDVLQGQHNVIELRGL